MKPAEAAIPVPGRGTEDQFQTICQLMNDNTQEYTNTSKGGMYMPYVSKQDQIFSTLGWTREEFYKELNKRAKSL